MIRPFADDGDRTAPPGAAEGAPKNCSNPEPEKEMKPVPDVPPFHSSTHQSPGSDSRIGLAGCFQETRAAWGALTFYERFEQIVVLLLTTLIALIVAVAVWHLALRILALLVVDAVDPTNPAVFQTIFGMVMTVLIALEFKHSLLGVLERRHGVVQVRTVVLIALLALVRKFIILDATKVEAGTLIGLALTILSLGIVHWLVRDQDSRENS